MELSIEHVDLTIKNRDLPPQNADVNDFCIQNWRSTTEDLGYPKTRIQPPNMWIETGFPEKPLEKNRVFSHEFHMWITPPKTGLQPEKGWVIDQNASEM